MNHEIARTSVAAHSDSFNKILAQVLKPARALNVSWGDGPQKREQIFADLCSKQIVLGSRLAGEHNGRLEPHPDPVRPGEVGDYRRNVADLSRIEKNRFEAFRLKFRGLVRLPTRFLNERVDLQTENSTCSRGSERQHGKDNGRMEPRRLAAVITSLPISLPHRNCHFDYVPLA